MKITETGINGCYVLSPFTQHDDRGHFIKWFSSKSYEAAGLCTEWMEVYGSISKSGVIRGLHFQPPPVDHAKVVYCLAGKAFDVVVDLRCNSRSFGEHIQLELNADKPTAVYIPPGCAHGFLSLADETLIFYQVSSNHAPTLEAGVRWDSVGINWPIKTPIISKRDANLPKFVDFDSPFRES
jgi:dTDP-4-dehydrorhamnose 3,5-epimerase